MKSSCYFPNCAFTIEHSMYCYYFYLLSIVWTLDQYVITLMYYSFCGDSVEGNIFTYVWIKKFVNNIYRLHLNNLVI